jgi:membrane-associated protease RseP (regulator of RpoE activity)
MRISAFRIPLLALLVVVPIASRLAASGDPPKAEEREKKKKKIVIASPEKQIIVDGDRVTVVNDGDDPEIVADLAELDDEDLPGLLRFHGRSGGYLGVHSIEMTPELRQHFGAPKESGVLVGTVEPESPASKAGLQVGDIITAVDGEGIGSTRDLSRSVRRRKEGEKVRIDVLRDRSPKSLSVTVVERKDREMRLGDFGHGMRGFRWRDWDSDGPALAPVPPVPPVPPIAPDGSRWNGLRDRLDSLEKRLREIESRLPKP